MNTRKHHSVNDEIPGRSNLNINQYTIKQKIDLI